MKTFINTLSNTYKTLRLLSNPATAAYIEQQMQTSTNRRHTYEANAGKLGKDSIFYHKHYLVQVY